MLTSNTKYKKSTSFLPFLTIFYIPLKTYLKVFSLSGTSFKYRYRGFTDTAHLVSSD
jgi:hypothetical protein